jgi:hypothetical protein
VPKNIKLHSSIRGFTETSEIVNNRQRLTWTLSPEEFRPEEPGSTAPIDRDPHVIISSYPDLETIRRRFLDGAAPKSKPTPAIKDQSAGRSNH